MHGQRPHHNSNPAEIPHSPSQHQLNHQNNKPPHLIKRLDPIIRVENANKPSRRAAITQQPAKPTKKQARDSKQRIRYIHETAQQRHGSEQRSKSMGGRGARFTCGSSKTLAPPRPPPLRRAWEVVLPFIVGQARGGMDRSRPMRWGDGMDGVDELVLMIMGRAGCWALLKVGRRLFFCTLHLCAFLFLFFFFGYFLCFMRVFFSKRKVCVLCVGILKKFHKKRELEI